MDKSLTKLLKESSLIIIYGSGKSLLLNNLALHPEFKGKIFTGNFSISDLEQERGNIFIDDLDICPYFLPSPNPQENERVIKEWKMFLHSVFQKKQKVFLTTINLKNLDGETRENADLFIQTQGTSENKTKLNLEVNNGVFREILEIDLQQK